MKPQVADPISKAHQKADEMRKTKKKLMLDEARKQARQAKDQRLQEIILEFGLDPNAKWSMIEFDVPTEEELKEMEAGQSLMGSSEEDI
jgi:2-iminoacetate synthase ThiH